MTEQRTGGAAGAERPTIRVVAALVRDDDRYLITQRRPNAVLPLLWEFPGGKVEADETDEEALRRELEHRLDVTAEIGRLISFVSHAYDKYTVDLHLYEASLVGGEPRERAVNAFRWVASSEFEQVAFTPADERSMSLLLGLDGA